MRQLFTIFFFSTVMTTINAQIPNGLYFENINGTKWSGTKIIDESGFFKYEDFSLSLLKTKLDSATDIKCRWLFYEKNVSLISKQDTLCKLEYKIDKDERNIYFKSKVDSISFEYVSVSTGSFVEFSVNRNVEIVGEAQNSKDGAIIKSKGLIYRINNKNEWETTYLGKIVKVNAKIIYNEYTTETDLGYDTGILKQGRLGRTITVSLKGKTEIINVESISNDIIGEWGIYVTKHNGVSAMCNVCPRIEFKTDSTARIKLPNGEYENYSWKIKENNIVIKPERKDVDNYLSDNTYGMEFKQEDEFTELVLKIKGLEYILRK